VSYINDILDEVSSSMENEDMELLSRYFITDSTFIWTVPGIVPGNSGWKGFSGNLDVYFRLRSELDRSAKNRIINIDDQGNVAWFIETGRVSFVQADSSYNYPSRVTSGVLTKLGSEWRIVQWHESY
jgi:hypothetical protein